MNVARTRLVCRSAERMLSVHWSTYSKARYSHGRCGLLSHAPQANRVAIFGTHFVDIMKMIKAEKRWHREPLGPCGTVVKIINAVSLTLP